MKKIAFLASLLCATFAMATPTITGMSQIDLSTSGQTDKYVRFVLADEFSDGFDNTWDTPAPNESGIYVYYGTDRYTGWASKQYTASLPLGFYTGENTAYTLKFSNFMGTEYTIYDRVADQIITVNGSTANYNFTIDESLKNSQINDRFIINPVYVEGSWNGWASWSVAFWDNGDGSVICEVENLEANTEYEFGLHFGTQSGSWATNGYTYKSDYKSTADFEQDALAGNMKLQTEAAGTYTFKWEYATRTFSITFPAPVPTCTTVRTGMVVDNYYTICLPKAVTAANGASFWNMSNRGDGVAYLVEAELPLVAGRPYIIQAEDAELCVEYSGDEVAAGAFGALHGTLEPMDQTALNAAGSDIYLLKNNELRLVSGQTGNSLAANRAYIKYSELNYSTPNPAPGRRVRAIPMQDQSTTGVENLNADEAPVKTVIDGKMYILRGEHMFDATGRMVK